MNLGVIGGRCPWHGSECVCDGKLDPNIDPHRGRWAKWMTIDGMIPPHCEAHIPTWMVGAYLSRVSPEKRKEYEDMVKATAKVKPPDDADDDENESS
jgi:hypothetical protein